MDIRQLRAVVAVVDHGGVTRAAEELHVAQPSLSQTIQSLEREVGVALFQRVGRRLVLTAAGEALLAPARQVLRDMATVAASVAEVRGLAAGRLDLVAEPTLAVDPVAGLIGAFRIAHPSVVVRLAEPEGAAEVVQRLADGRSEIGLAELPVLGSGLVTEELAVQDVLAVRPPGSPPMPEGLAVADLAGVPLVTTPIGTSSRALIERALARASVAPVVAVETEQREALLPLVLAGAGTALLPRPLAEEAARRGAVVVSLRPPLRRTVGLVYRRAQLSPAARVFVELARSQKASSSSSSSSSGSSSSSSAKAASSRASQSTGSLSTIQDSPSKRTRR